MLVFPLRMLANAIAAMARGAASAARVLRGAVDRARRSPTPSTRSRCPTVDKGEVRFEHVSFGYGDASPDPRRPRRSRSAAARRSRSSAATGSGKSTVGRLLPRFYEPSAGTIRSTASTSASWRQPSCAAPIAIVFEETFLFTDTVRDNIAFAEPGGDSDDDVVRAAELAGAHEFISALPDGLRDDARRGRASRSRAGSASASRSPAPSSPTPGC